MTKVNLKTKKSFNMHALIFMGLMLVFLPGCDSNGAKAQDDICITGDPERADRVSGTLDRVELALALNEDGTLFINQDDPDYAMLEDGDESFGQAVVDMFNGKVQRGECQANEDLTVECSGLSRNLGSSANCKTKWWGECCFEDAEVTSEICSQITVDGTGADIICQLIPVVDVICDVIIKVGVAPIQGEICPCAFGGESSSFHATWLDVLWFKCGDDC